jgi:hypothetical protein
MRKVRNALYRKPEPWHYTPPIIRVLRDILGESQGRTAEDARAAAAEILGAWIAREDLGELRDLCIGRKGERGNTVKGRQVDKELRYVTSFIKNQTKSNPYTAVASDRNLFPNNAEKFLDANRKKVEAAVKKWRGTRMWDLLSATYGD